MGEENNFWPEFIKPEKTGYEQPGHGAAKEPAQEEGNSVKDMFDLLLNQSCPRCNKGDAVISVMEDLRQCTRCQHLWGFDDTIDTTNVMKLNKDCGMIKPCRFCKNDSLDRFTVVANSSEILCGQCGNVYNVDRPEQQSRRAARGNHGYEANGLSPAATVCRNCKNRRPELFDKEYDNRGCLNFSSCLLCSHVASTADVDFLPDEEEKQEHKDEKLNNEKRFYQNGQEAKGYKGDEGAAGWQIPEADKKILHQTASKIAERCIENIEQGKSVVNGIKEAVADCLVEPLGEHLFDKIGAMVGRDIIKTEGAETLGGELGSIIGQMLAVQISKRLKKDTPEYEGD